MRYKHTKSLFHLRKKNNKSRGSTSKNKLVDILTQNKNMALLIGNGLNHYFYESTSLSWLKLVVELWNKRHPNTPISEKEARNKKVSFTETVEMSEKSFEDIRDSIAKEFGKNTPPNQKAQKFLEYLEEHDIPIITTNYDKNIVNELQLSDFNTSKEIDEEKIISSRFQWGRYYAKEEIPDTQILEKFAVWNAHGTIDHPRGICLSLSDYLECCRYAYEVLENIYSVFYFKKSGVEPKFKETWLNILFNKNICIMGLALDENELFLRLLLMLRFKYMSNYLNDSNKYKGWYLYDNDGQMTDSKRFFLDSVNVQPVKLKRKNIYTL